MTIIARFANCFYKTTLSATRFGVNHKALALGVVLVGALIVVGNASVGTTVGDCGYPNPPHCPLEECGDPEICGLNCYGAAANGAIWTFIPPNPPIDTQWKVSINRCGTEHIGAAPTISEAISRALGVLYSAAGCQ